MADLADVRRLALALPETSERLTYGTPGFRVADKIFARIRESGDVLVVWCGDEHEKQALIAGDPNRIFTLPHYDSHASVLLQLPSFEPAELDELLTDAWRVRAPKKIRIAWEAAQGPAAD